MVLIINYKMSIFIHPVHCELHLMKFKILSMTKDNIYIIGHVHLAIKLTSLRKKLLISLKFVQ